MRRQDNVFLSNRNIALAIIVAVGAFSLLCSPVRAVLTEVLYSVAPSVWKTRSTAMGVEDGIFANFQIKRSLAFENAALREEVSRMQALVLDRNLLEERVFKLEEALGRTSNDNRVSAEVLSVPLRSPYDILVIDAGEDHGIAVGNSVVYAGSGAIGETVEVYGSSSKVKLYSSPTGERLVLVGKNAIPGAAHGRGMGNFEVRLPKGSGVSVGDTVVMPKGGLILGIVGLVEEEPTLPFVNVLFRTTFNISDIRSVEVIIH